MAAQVAAPGRGRLLDSASTEVVYAYWQIYWQIWGAGGPEGIQALFRSI